MDKETRAALSTLGTGLAAGAAGYGASAAMGGDNSSSLMAGTASGLLAALLAHMIMNKTLKESRPLVNRPVATAASLLAGTTTGVGALGGLSYIDDKYGKTISGFLPSLYNKGKASNNEFIKSLSTTLDKYNNSINNTIATLGTPTRSKDGKIIPPKTSTKILGKMLRNKKAVGAGAVGLATMPLVYKLLRGNGSD